MKRLRAIRTWLADEWACWRMWHAAWLAEWHELRALSRNTIAVPIAEYCLLLGAADREKLLLAEIISARDTIRSLERTIRQYSTIAERGAEGYREAVQVLIDRRPATG